MEIVFVPSQSKTVQEKNTPYTKNTAGTGSFALSQSQILCKRKIVQ